MADMSSDVEAAKRDELRKKVEYRVACEERAFRIVEKLIENPVEEHYFLESAQLITPEHYTDIVEERAVASLCGYPLCRNPLGPVPKKKYAISTKTNKVYDIETRKNFCSNKCFKASTYFEKQISSVPVWTRKNQPLVKFKLLPLGDMKVGRVGEEVLVSNRGAISQDVRQLERMDHYQEALQNCLHGDKSRGHSQGQSHGSGDSGSDEGDDEGEGQVYTLERALDEMRIGTHTVENGATNHKASVTKGGASDLKSAGENLKSRIEVNQSQSPAATQQATSKSVAESKTEYLMRLLDKKKSMLSKMVDIQNSEPQAEIKSNKTVKEENGVSCGSDDVMFKVHGSEVTGEEPFKRFEDEKRFSAKRGGQEEVVHSVVERTSESLSSQKNIPARTVVADVKATESAGQRSRAVEASVTRSSRNILEVISRGVREWMTPQSVEYLKTVQSVERTLKPSTYEEKYRALVASVDAQEREFTDLLGEENIQGDSSDVLPGGRLPHFDLLKRETEEMNMKVQEFMKGSFTYKPGKTEDETHTGQKDPDARDRGDIVLPSVDRYDVLLIRQKLVLDRINRALPDLLSPLKLLTQDVFTELREVVVTFNLTSENILFKPAEWTMVSLILLKLLSRKLHRVEEAFRHHSAQRYLDTLLTGVGQTVVGLDSLVDHLLTSS